MSDKLSTLCPDHQKIHILFVHDLLEIRHQKPLEVVCRSASFITLPNDIDIDIDINININI